MHTRTERLKSPRFAIALLTVLIVGLTFAGSRHLGAAYFWLYGLLFAALFAVICWHLFDFLRSLMRGIRTIGQPSHPRFFGIPKWKLYATIFAIFIPAMAIVGIVGTRHMDVYKQSVSELQSSPQARSLFGEDVRVGWWVNSSYEATDQEGHCEINAAVSGKLAHGHMDVAGVKTGGKWRITQFKVKKDNGAWIDLLQPTAM